MTSVSYDEPIYSIAFFGTENYKSPASDAVPRPQRISNNGGQCFDGAGATSIPIHGHNSAALRVSHEQSTDIE